MADESLRLSVVVPCHNERDALPELFRRISTVCQQSEFQPCEIIFVDDGSTDDTWAIIRGLAGGPLALRAVRLSRNFGHQAALTAGLERARGGRIFILDADLQDPPELLSIFWGKLDEGYDVAYGVRQKRNGEGCLKLCTAWFFYRLLHFLSEVSVPLDTGDYRLMSRRATDALLALPERSRFIRGMVAWVGFRQVGVAYDRDVRIHGATKYDFKRMFFLAIDGLTSFSIRPLRLGILLGVIMWFLSLVIIGWGVMSWAFGYVVRGWASILVVVLAVGGTQTLLLGVIGEYVGKLFIEAKGRPLYFECESLGETHDT